MPAGLVSLESSGEIFLIRVGIDFGEYSPAEASLIEQVECILRNRQIGETAVGDQQRLAHSGRLAGIGYFADTSGAESN